MLAMVANRPKAAAGLASFRERSDIRNDLSGEPAGWVPKTAVRPAQRREAKGLAKGGEGWRRVTFFETS